MVIQRDIGNLFLVSIYDLIYAFPDGSLIYS